MRAVRLVLFLCLMGALPGAAAAQVSDVERSRYSSAAYYNYAEEADVAVTASVWGSVRNPGLYDVPQDTRLSELFSLAGGPTIGEQRTDREQRLVVRLSRAQSGGARSVVFEKEMEDEVLTFDIDPAIQPGDVLTVERFVRDRFTWRDALPIIGAATSVASTILTIIAIRRN